MCKDTATHNAHKQDAVCKSCAAVKEDTLSSLTSGVAEEDNKQGTKAERPQGTTGPGMPP